MDLRVKLECTKFITKNNTKENYGYILYDDYVKTFNCDMYDTNWKNEKLDNRDFLRFVLRWRVHSRAKAVFENLLLGEQGLFVNGEWLEFSDCKEMLLNFCDEEIYRQYLDQGGTDENYSNRQWNQSSEDYDDDDYYDDDDDDDEDDDDY